LKDDALKDFNEFLREFQDETDRGAALVGAALIDLRLKETLAAFFADQKVGAELLEAKGNGPLSTMGARIKIALCLGLIDRDEFEECKLISKIRNEFAHRTHGTTFRDKTIAAYCFKLKIGFPTKSPLINPRLLFTHSVFLVALGLSNRSEHAAAEKRAIRTPNPVLQIEALPPAPQEKVPPES
jgi:mannitol operon repressor